MLIRVSVHKHNGAIIWLDVDRHDTVRKLKLMIQDSPEMRRIPAYHQHLKHGRYYGNIIITFIHHKGSKKRIKTKEHTYRHTHTHTHIHPNTPTI